MGETTVVRRCENINVEKSGKTAAEVGRQDKEVDKWRGMAANRN